MKRIEVVNQKCCLSADRKELWWSRVLPQNRPLACVRTHLRCNYLKDCRKRTYCLDGMRTWVLPGAVTISSSNTDKRSDLVKQVRIEAMVGSVMGQCEGYYFV